MKDNFSTNSEQYSKFRPHYPPELFDFLNTIVNNREAAWDAGTGNGQVAYQLSKSFKYVYATDISRSQLDHAINNANIFYSLQPAEQVDFQNEFFDLITVAQAIHWFDFEKFYREVNRVGKKDGILAVIGYGGVKLSTEIDAIKYHFYKEIVGPYWDKERSYIDEDYKTIPFPFQEISSPQFANKLKWSREEFLGYINTWSAVKSFISQNAINPVDWLSREIAPYWNEGEVKDVMFPVFLRMGKIS